MSVLTTKLVELARGSEYGDPELVAIAEAALDYENGLAAYFSSNELFTEHKLSEAEVNEALKSLDAISNREELLSLVLHSIRVTLSTYRSIRRSGHSVEDRIAEGMKLNEKAKL